MSVALNDTIVHGDCVKIMAAMPAASVDFILTDPPYRVAYKPRDKRAVRNDDNAAWLELAFTEMHRLLKPNAFAITFYGYTKTDLFFAAWRKAGFRIGGHIVFRKKYPSRMGYLRGQHATAYLLVKGKPTIPAAPLSDVMDWRYTGNKFHPTQKSVHILRPLIEAFTQPGDLVLDPFAGSGSTCVAARVAGRRTIGIELDADHHKTAAARLKSVCIATRHAGWKEMSPHRGNHAILRHTA